MKQIYINEDDNKINLEKRKANYRKWFKENDMEQEKWQWQFYLSSR